MDDKKNQKNRELTDKKGCLHWSGAAFMTEDAVKIF